MVTKYLRFGSIENAHAWDDGDYDSAIETDAPIKAGTPVDSTDVLRLGDVGSAVGDVIGPTGATDEAVVLFDGITGKLIKNSAVTIDGTGNIIANSITLSNTGLHVLDTNASHDLIISPGSDLTADHTLTLTTGDADRTITLSGNLTVESTSLINQDLTTDSTTPQFAGLTINGTSSLNGAVTINDSGADVDTRIEGDTLPYLFHVDAGRDTVKIGEAGANPSSTNVKLCYHTNGYTSFEMRCASDLSFYRNGMNWRRSRGTLSAPTAVQNGDWLGDFNAVARDTAGGEEGAAALVFKVDGAPSADYVPGRIDFFVTKDATEEVPSVVSNRLTIRSTGYVGIRQENPTSLLHANGSLALAIVTKTANYTLDGTDYTVLLDGTSNTVTGTLPTAVGITGRIYCLKCINNTYACDIATTSSQTIDGYTSNYGLVLNEPVFVQSDGANWKVLNKLTIAYGEMYVYENTTLTTIDTQDVYHAIGNFSTGLVNGFTYVAGLEGSGTVTDYSDTVADTVLLTDVAHGLLTGDIITCHGSTDYNGTFQITKVSDDSFYFIDTYTSDQSTDWSMGDYLLVGARAEGVYKVSLSLTAFAASANTTFKFELNKNLTPLDNIAMSNKFGSTDYTALSSSGLVSLVYGDRIWCSCKNQTSATDITVRHMNVSLIRV